MDELTKCFADCIQSEAFLNELAEAQETYSGRPSALTHLKNLSNHLGGAQIYLKNEGLNHTGAHKINHCIGQVLLAKHQGKRRIIAETGAGQHGYATAAVCARYDMDCTIYMGAVDYARQRPNVFWMETMGAKVVPVTEGSQTLNDAVIAAFKDLIAHPDEGHYLLGSAVGPHPFPLLNTYFQKVIGEESKIQLLAACNQNPKEVVACVGGGSNAMGMFFDFLDDENVLLTGVEAGGKGKMPGEHAAKINYGKVGIFEGYHSYFLQDNDGNISDTHSISAGLDYCGISPILAYLYDEGRVQFKDATDSETLDALQLLAKKEGIILAMETSHALAYVIERAKEMNPSEIILLNGSGRGEKDLFISMKHLQKEQLKSFLQNQLNQL
ncbi:UNVERIFIED_CONTAM: hypothetical protein GTU68_061165 [Idotea baltica]|nr:hypothetical protein [Idotea baltica]